MASFIDTYGFQRDPFEFYVAENEPDIDEYAVRPPYFVDAEGRARRTSTFILFGSRGSGKSATRLTVFKEIWKKINAGQKAPLPVTLTDFSPILNGRAISSVSSGDYIRHVAFLVVEALLLWLSNQSEEDIGVYLDGMDTSTSCWMSSSVIFIYRDRAMNGA